MNITAITGRLARAPSVVLRESRTAPGFFQGKACPLTRRNVRRDPQREGSRLFQTTTLSASMVPGPGTGSPSSSRPSRWKGMVSRMSCSTSTRVSPTTPAWVAQARTRPKLAGSGSMIMVQVGHLLYPIAKRMFFRTIQALFSDLM